MINDEMRLNLAKSTNYATTVMVLQLKYFNSDWNEYTYEILTIGYLKLKFKALLILIMTHAVYQHQNNNQQQQDHPRSH